MPLSLSQKLFFRINALTGRSVALDRAMIIIAHGFVYLVIAGALWWAVQTLSGREWLLFLTEGLAAYCIGYILNYGIALLVPHRRPIKEFPNVRTLVHTLGTWKSFPSDHAMASMILPTIALFAGAPAGIAVALFAGALLVAVSRVYVGVHYPRDIIGGLMVGAFSAIVAHIIFL
jgi:undecaprenyl-diphosphatase